MGLFKGLFSDKPKIKTPPSIKRDGYSGWIKCAHCHDMIHANELQENLHCCPKCDHHYRLNGVQRVAFFADEGTFRELFTDLQAGDPLSFCDTEKYEDRLRNAQSKSGRDEAAIVGTCEIVGQAVALGVLDFSFMAGSMGSVVGERLACLIEYALEHALPVVIVSASGGARMQESCLSLMQMAKTSAALAKLGEAGLPYVSVLTNPTTGGVTASFASLGDVIFVEPGALVAFAGPRVVEQTIGEKLPPGAQKAEFLCEKGMVDCVVNRHQLKEKVAEVISFLTGNERLYFASESEKRTLPTKLRELLAVARSLEPVTK